MLSSTAGCQIITIDGEGTAEVGENGVVGNGAIGLSVSTLNNPFFVSLAEVTNCPNHIRVPDRHFEMFGFKGVSFLSDRSFYQLCSVRILWAV